ncbi:MAG: Crp/Fnr family transcriptional regulator [Thermoanaerobaculia bacterium]
MSTIDRVAPVAVSPLIRNYLITRGEQQHFESGDVLFREGDRAENLMLIMSGAVSLEVHLPKEGRVVLQTLGDAELFGWSAILDPRIETASARVIEPSEIVVMSGKRLMGHAELDPDFGRELYRVIAEVVAARLIATRMQVVEMMTDL